MTSSNNKFAVRMWKKAPMVPHEVAVAYRVFWEETWRGQPTRSNANCVARNLANGTKGRSPLSVRSAYLFARDCRWAATQWSGILGAYRSPFYVTDERRTPIRATKICRGQQRRRHCLFLSCLTGVWGNYLNGSVVAAGMDPDNCHTRMPLR